MADDDSAYFPGFDEANAEFDRVTRVKLLDDAALLQAFGVLSDDRRVQRTHLLALIEDEIRRRGLAAPN